MTFDPSNPVALADQMAAELTLTEQETESMLGNQTDWMKPVEAFPLIEKLIANFEANDKSKYNSERDSRKLDLNVEQLQKDGKLLADETIIPVRMIETNIRRETPRYVSYLMGSRLMALSPDGADIPPKVVEALEKRHHQLMTYPNWLRPWFSVIDGACTHGTDYLEVVYDQNYPGHVAIEHIGVLNLVLNTCVADVQRAPILLRKYELSIDDLRLYRDKFGFTGVDLLIQDLPEPVKREGGVTEVYKCLFRINGIVHVAWYAKLLAHNYLKDPAPIDLGLKEKIMIPGPQVPAVDPITGIPAMDPMTGQVLMTDGPAIESWVPIKIKEYPIVAYRYYVTEDPKIKDATGRVYSDLPYQTAITTAWSSMVNGMVRASGVYGSPSNPTGSTMAASTIPLRHGHVYTAPINFWSPPAPDPNMLPMIQALYAQTVQEAGHFDYASRDKGGKTRPTATEVTSSSETTQQYSSVGLAMFSETVRQVCDLTWKILTNLAQQDEIFLYGNRNKMIDPATGQLIDVIENDQLVVKEAYIVRAAGDIDVVQRGQRIQKLLEMWPLVAGTPVAGPYLSKLLRIALPEDGDAFALIIEQTSGIPPAELVAKLLALVQATLDPADTQGLAPQEVQQMQLLIQQAQQYATSGVGNPEGVPAPQSQAAPQPAA